MRVIDLSHTIRTGMQIYPGDPDVAIERALTHENDYCHVDRLLLGSHSGTHIDAPLHFLSDGKRISDFPADKFIGKGVVLDVRGKKENEPITLADILPYEKQFERGCFAVLMTGWSEHFGTEAYEKHPYLSKEGADFFVEKGVSIVGLDALNIDSTVSEIWDAHDTLLSNDTLIVENLSNLSALDPSKSYYFSFLPLKLDDTDGSPIRATAIEAGNNF